MLLKLFTFREVFKTITSRVGVGRTVTTMRTVSQKELPGSENDKPNGITRQHSREDVPPKSKYTICVEGNIGSGKTTLLDYYKDYSMTEVFQEPVHKWRDIKGHNALSLMYKDPARWGLTFQTYVQLIMLGIHMEAQEKPIKMMERSIFSAKYCFVDNLHNSGKMPDIEHIVLTEWFDFIVKSQDFKVDLIVYLQTKPETVYERIQRRQRQEEKNIPLEYLEALHKQHEDWLIHKKYPCPADVLVLDGNPDANGMVKIYEENRSQILKHP
ncbi:thymidine kinase 2, mitochondrial-like [Haliotis rufescens]|uniref:thymidine kinase 2, mitochondrial-like n=1 Tax=Haliotis rufescens TaxID=6454 RepID=UPI001EB06F72|nr:thymidine kinase 2, mitochondrial-like [Haliotis rufescens]